MDLVAAIKKRKSVRRYQSHPVPQGIVRQVVEAGYGSLPLRPEIGVRWYVAWDGRTLGRNLGGLSGVYGMFTSAPHYLIAISQERPGYLVNIGFRMEQLILIATALGLGTCWVGGMFSEAQVRTFIPNLSADERVVALTPLGYADTSRGARMASQVVRWGTDWLGRRKPLHEIVSQDIWAVPWAGEDETLNWILDLTRLAPSWANTQPWHFVVSDHHVLATVNHVAQRGNVREGKPYYLLDGGIAMCHFDLAARAAGWPTGRGRETCWHLPRGDESQELGTRYAVPDEYDILGVLPIAT